MTSDINLVSSEQTIVVEGSARPLAMVSFPSYTITVDGLETSVTGSTVNVVSNLEEVDVYLTGQNINLQYTTTIININSPPGGGGNGGDGSYEVVFNGSSDTVIEVVGGYRWYPPVNSDLYGVRISLGISPTSGQECIVDVNKNGSTIFANPSDRPTLGPGEHTSIWSSTTSFLTTDYLTFDVDQAAGQKLTIQALFRPQ